MVDRCAAFLVSTFIVLALVTPASAHKLKIFATAAGREIEGTVYFVGGQPVGGAAVRVTDAEGGELAQLVTDQEGRFRMTARDAVSHVFNATVGDGHTARFTISGADLDAVVPAGAEIGAGASTGAATASEAPRPPGNPPSEPLSPAAMRSIVDQAVAQQVRPLRAELNAYQDDIRFRDVLGGVGYIIGLAGVALWCRARMSRPAERR